MIGRPGPVVVVGGTLVDREHPSGWRADVVVVDGRVVAVGPNAAREAPSDSFSLDATGALIFPGLVDIHTHLREPGGEAAETIESGTNAAALGGYTTVLAMPNTAPAIDSAAVVQQVQAIAAKSGRVAVAVAAAITQGRAGATLAPMAELFDLGVRVFTDDGAGVQDSRLMRRALEYAGALRAPDGTRAVLAQHCEDAALFEGGHMNEGRWSSLLGIPGVPAAAEELMVARDIALSELTGTPVHFLHLSTAGSVRLVREARARGLAVTAEVAPHHLTLSDACASSFDPVFKVNPPLRSESDVHAVRAGLAQGVFSAIATDHAPHQPDTKEAPWALAPPGMLGLQTAFALLLRLVDEPVLPRLANEPVLPRLANEPVLPRLANEPLTQHKPGDSGGTGDWDEAQAPAGRVGGIVEVADRERIGLVDLLAAMSWGPAAVAGLTAQSAGLIAPGAPADLCVFDPHQQWRVDSSSLASRAKNSPYEAMAMRGQVRHTVCAGSVVVDNGELV